MSPALVESNVVNIALNRFREVWDEPKIVSKYKNGRHGGEWQSYLVSELVAINFRLAAAWIRLGMMPGERVAIMARYTGVI